MPAGWVLFVETSPYPSFGGSKRVLCNVAAELVRRGWDARALFPRAGPWIEELQAHGVAVSAVEWLIPSGAGAIDTPAPLHGLRALGVVGDQGNRRRRGWRHLAREARQYYRLLIADPRSSRRLEPLIPEGPGVLHLNGPAHEEYEWVRAAMRRRVPFITHEHRLWRTPPRAWRIVARRAGAVICLTPERAAQVRAFCGEGVRVEIVPNGIPAGFHPQRSRCDVREKLGIPEDGFLLLTPGHVQPWKGQALAVESAALLRDRGVDFRWMLCGSFLQQDYLEAIQARIRALGLEREILLPGERHDLPDLYAAADLLVHTTLEPEPFGMVLVEAMAAGLPVVASRAGAVPGIVRDQLDGLLYPAGSVEPMTTAIVSLLRDPGRREKMAESGRSRVDTHFRIEHQADALERIYFRAMGSPA